MDHHSSSGGGHTLLKPLLLPPYFDEDRPQPADLLHFDCFSKTEAGTLTDSTSASTGEAQTVGLGACLHSDDCSSLSSFAGL